VGAFSTAAVQLAGGEIAKLGLGQCGEPHLQGATAVANLRFELNSLGFAAMLISPHTEASTPRRSSGHVENANHQPA
jgi:hypothetical protein